MLPVNKGALVIKGSAGGLYDLCLDKQTMYPVFGHVDPALGYLVFRPLAANGNFTLINGIPISAQARGAEVEKLRAQGLLAPLAAEEETACALAACTVSSEVHLPAVVEAHSSAGSAPVTLVATGADTAAPIAGSSSHSHTQHLQEQAAACNAPAAGRAATISISASSSSTAAPTKDAIAA